MPPPLPPEQCGSFLRNMRLFPKKCHKNLNPNRTLVLPPFLPSGFSENPYDLPPPPSWSDWALPCYLSLQEKLQVALKKLRKEQELAEKLEMDVVTKRAAWKARVTSPKAS